MQQNIEKVNDSLSHLVNRFVPLMANMGHTRPDAGASSQQQESQNTSKSS